MPTVFQCQLKQEGLVKYKEIKRDTRSQSKRVVEIYEAPAPWRRTIFSLQRPGTGFNKSRLGWPFTNRWQFKRDAESYVSGHYSSGVTFSDGKYTQGTRFHFTAHLFGGHLNWDKLARPHEQLMSNPQLILSSQTCLHLASVLIQRILLRLPNQINYLLSHPSYKSLINPANVQT